jgi:hypothetical protein
MLVTNKGKFIRHFEGVRVVPGAQELADDQLQLIKELADQYPIYATYAKDLDIDLTQDFVKQSETPLTVAQLTEKLPEITDLNLLNKMYNDEAAAGNRTTALSAISSRISELQGQSNVEGSQEG